MRRLTLFLLSAGLALLLNACSAPKCERGAEWQSANPPLGRQAREATFATLCTDKGQYSVGDVVHITFTVKNALDEQIVLDGGQQPVMDVCNAPDRCLSLTQPGEARLTYLVLEPGQSHTIEWDWPQSYVEEILSQVNEGYVYALWLGARGGVGDLRLLFVYGDRLMGP